MKRVSNKFSLPEDRERVTTPRWVLVACAVVLAVLVILAMSSCASTAQVDPFDKLIENAGTQLFSPQLEGGAL